MILKLILRLGRGDRNANLEGLVGSSLAITHWPAKAFQQPISEMLECKT
jgi:hypothetical protein